MSQIADDLIVVGSGHNGLIAAAYLAKVGKKVLVLERNDHVGGGSLTGEVTAPGFRHYLHAVLHVLIQANPIIRNDELGLAAKFGLKYRYPEAISSTVFDDGDSIITNINLDKTCDSIARVSPWDAEAYCRFYAQSAAMLPLVVKGMFVPPIKFIPGCSKTRSRVLSPTLSARLERRPV